MKQPKIPYPKEEGAPKPNVLKPPPGPPAGPTGDDFFEDDFTGVEGGFPMAEEGRHYAKVIDFERSDSQSGNPQYVWQFRITDGPSKGVELRYWTSLLPQARWKAAETLEAVGVKAVGSMARFGRSDIVGKACILEVVHETYDGRLRHKVQKVYAPDERCAAAAKRDEDTPF